MQSRGGGNVLAVESESFQIHWNRVKCMCFAFVTRNGKRMKRLTWNWLLTVACQVQKGTSLTRLRSCLPCKNLFSMSQRGLKAEADLGAVDSVYLDKFCCWKSLRSPRSMNPTCLFIGVYKMMESQWMQFWSSLLVHVSGKVYHSRRRCHTQLTEIFNQINTCTSCVEHGKSF